MARRLRSMHLDGPEEGESFMIREGVSAEGDDIPEWLDNERVNPIEEPDDELAIEEEDDDDEDNWDDPLDGVDE